MSTMTITERKTETEAALAKLHAAVAEITTGEEWAAWLAYMGKLHGYSPLNRMWLWVQWEGRKAKDATLPDVGECAGYKAWQALGRQVVKGEKALSVFAPIIVTDKDAAPVNGKAPTKLIGFKIVNKTFSVNQTEGAELPVSPTRPVLVEGEADKAIWAKLVEIAESIGFRVVVRELNPANGMCDYSLKTITIAEGRPGAQQVKTLIHEIAHALMHNPEQYLLGHRDSTNIIEVEAESVAFVVSSMLGLNTMSYSLPYVAHWAEGNAKLVTDTATRVLATANKLIELVEGAA